MASRKSPSDWSRIAIEYLSGEYSVREIADRYEITEGAIRKRAKAEGWVRPPQKVRNVRTSSENRDPPAPRPPEEPVTPGVIADRGRNLIMRMMDELDTTTSHLGELEEMIEDETAADRSGKRRDAMLGAISLGGRAKTLKELATAFKTINEASAPHGKKAAAQDAARDVAAGSRFRPVGPPALSVVKK